MASTRLLASLLVLIIAFGQCKPFKFPKVAHDDSDDDVNLKIVNGEYADDHNDFPFQAYLFTVWNKVCDKTSGMCQYSGSSCGGAIVNTEFIITAAHVSRTFSRPSGSLKIR